MHSRRRKSLLAAELTACGLGLTTLALLGDVTAVGVERSAARVTFERPIPAALPDHPGNVFLEGEHVRIPVPERAQLTAGNWRLSDLKAVVRTGVLASGPDASRSVLELGELGIGWYRVDFSPTNANSGTWTTLAVLGRWRAPVPADSPVAVDSAAAWFARDDASRQRQLASLASLAGVSWVRDRLRWRDLQPAPGDLVAPPTTYDTSADAHREAGLALLQVFHDTPPWAHEGGGSGSRFAPDLRRVFELGQRLARRFDGRVSAWEPWNEANVASFGGHTVDAMCSWQKAAWLGFKSVDSQILVGWNATAACPTDPHTEGVLANETWPYFDTYNIHSYDWAHSYAALWKPARAAAAGRPIWVTEADRGTPHLKDPPWFEQEPRLEKLKAEWMAQSYASSLFAGAQRHFHFILGHYQEPNVQFGLLRLDLTPRPAYVALAAVGRWLAGAKALGRWQPGADVQVYAFRARPDGQEQDVLVVWAEREVDWDDRGKTTAHWQLPKGLSVNHVVDHLGRSLGKAFPAPLTSAPVFVLLPAGQAASLPLEGPPAVAPLHAGDASPVVMQVQVPRATVRKVEDLPWSEGYAYHTAPGRPLEFQTYVYNFATNAVTGRLSVARVPESWQVNLSTNSLAITPGDRFAFGGTLTIPTGAATRDGWVVLRAACGVHGQPALAFRVIAAP